MRPRLAFLLILALAAAGAQNNRELVGKVVGVHDGDTLTLLVDRTQYEIRLDGIDAPELGQDFGTRAKQALSKACVGKTSKVETHGQDRYGRTLGEVFDGTIARGWSLDTRLMANSAPC